MINEDNIFLSAIREDKRVLRANAYSPEYFVMIKERKRRYAAIALAALAADLKFLSLDDLSNKKAVYQDITNEGFLNSLLF